jgi:hypothetical protein
MGHLGRWDSGIASNISVDASSFSGLLSVTDTDLQTALNSLDSATPGGVESGDASATMSADGLDITDGTDTVEINLDSGDVKIKNTKNGGKIVLEANNDSAVLTTLAEFDPEGISALYYAGTSKLATSANGVDIGTAAAATTINILGTEGTAGTISTSDSNLVIGSGGNVTIQIAGTETAVLCSNNAEVALFYDNVQKFATTLTGVVVSDGTTNATIQLDGFGNLTIDNEYSGGTFTLMGDNEGDKVLFNANPAGAVILYYAGTAIFQTTSAGISVTDGTANAATIGFSSDDLVIKNNDNDGLIYIMGQVSGGQRNMINCDPAGAIELYHAGSLTAYTFAGGFAVTDDGGTDKITIQQTGTNSYVRNTTVGGDLFLRVTASGPTQEEGIIIREGGPVDLYYDNVLKLRTATNGLEMVDAGTILWDDAPASDETGTGDEISETVDQNTYGIAGCLRKGSDGNWDDADKDASTTVGMLAIALESGTGTKRLLLRGFMRDDTWNWTPGEQLYVGDSGAITNDVSGYTTGDIVQVVGYAHTADIIYFNPSPDYLEVA